MSTKQLYIGINGLAGSGKDTVAKMLKVILSKDWNDIEEARAFYKKTYKLSFYIFVFFNFIIF